MLAKLSSVNAVSRKRFFCKYILSVGLSTSPGHLWEMGLPIIAFLVCARPYLQRLELRALVFLLQQLIMSSTKEFAVLSDLENKERHLICLGR